MNEKEKMLLLCVCDETCVNIRRHSGMKVYKEREYKDNM